MKSYFLFVAFGLAIQPLESQKKRARASVGAMQRACARKTGAEGRGEMPHAEEKCSFSHELT